MINYICDMALVHGYADGLTTIDENIIEAVLASRKESSLFNNKYQEDTAATNTIAPQNNTTTFPEIANLTRRISIMESMITSLNSQLNELISTRNVKDTLMLEIFTSLQESLKSRKQIALSYQKLSRRYQKLQKLDD